MGELVSDDKVGVWFEPFLSTNEDRPWMSVSEMLTTKMNMMNLGRGEGTEGEG